MCAGAVSRDPISEDRRVKYRISTRHLASQALALDLGYPDVHTAGVLRVYMQMVTVRR